MEQGAVQTEVLNPADLGLQHANLDGIRGGDVQENADILQQVLQGKGSNAQRDVVALNAGLALFTSRTVASYQAGIARSLEILNAGAAWQKLEQLVAFGQSV